MSFHNTSYLEDILDGVHTMLSSLQEIAPKMMPPSDAILTDDVITDVLNILIEVTGAKDIFESDFFSMYYEQWEMYLEEPTPKRLMWLIQEFGAQPLYGIEMVFPCLISDDLGEGMRPEYLGCWVTFLLTEGFNSFSLYSQTDEINYLADDERDRDPDVPYSDGCVTPAEADDLIAFTSAMSPMVSPASRAREWKYSDAEESPLLASFIDDLAMVDDPNPWSRYNPYQGNFLEGSGYEPFYVHWIDVSRALELKEKAHYVRSFLDASALENLPFLFSEIARVGLVKDPDK